MSDIIPTGVVLDEPQANALLIAAIEEGLVEDPIKYDWAPRITPSGSGRNSPMYDGLLRAALEQLMIGGRVYLPYTPQWCRNEWRGELFDEGILVKARRDPSDSEFPMLSPDVVTSMLVARGYNELSTFDAVKECVDEYLAASEEWDTLFPDRKLSWSEAFAKQLQVWLTKDDSLFPEQAAYQRLNAAKGGMWPIEHVFRTAQFIIECSLEANALSAIPHVPATESGNLISANTPNVHTNMHLVRIVDEELGPLPVGHNLKTTIQRSKSNAADDFRHEMARWTHGIQTGELKSIDQVRKRAIDARNGIERSGGYSMAGSLCTVVGFATGGIGLAATIPVLAGLGLGASLIGGVVLGAEHLSRVRAGRWAMFVHRNK